MVLAFDLTVTMGVIVTLVIAIVSWIRAIRKVIDDRAFEMAARLGRHDQRIAAAEQTLQGMPAKDDLHDLRISLEGLRGDIKEMRVASAAATEAARRQDVVVQRVEQYLLERK